MPETLSKKNEKMRVHDDILSISIDDVDAGNTSMSNDCEKLNMVDNMAGTQELTLVEELHLNLNWKDDQKKQMRNNYI